MSITGNVVGGIIPDTVKAHMRSKDNPHGVTASQIGAATPADVQKIARANLLDNWYFGNPVNQRGQTEYTGGGYTIDRWKIEGTINASLKVVDGGIQFINQSGANGLFRQYLEGGLAGKQVTFSILVTELTGRAYFAINNQHLHVGLNTQTFSVGESGVPTTYFWISPDGGSITVTAAKLELGDTQTLAHQDADGNWVLNEIPNYAEELAKCQRYYEEMDYIALIGKTLDDTLPYKVTKRVNPTLQLISNNGVSGKVSYWNGSAWIDFTGDASYIGVKGTYGCRIYSSAGNTPSEATGSTVSCRVVANADL